MKGRFTSRIVAALKTAEPYHCSETSLGFYHWSGPEQCSPTKAEFRFDHGRSLRDVEPRQDQGQKLVLGNRSATVQVTVWGIETESQSCAVPSG